MAASVYETRISIQQASNAAREAQRRLDEITPGDIAMLATLVNDPLDEVFAQARQSVEIVLRELAIADLALHLATDITSPDDEAEDIK
jgi:hypothetical protein